MADHAAAHLACSDDTGLDDLSFFFPLLQFPVHVQHNDYPPRKLFYVC